MNKFLKLLLVILVFAMVAGLSYLGATNTADFGLYRSPLHANPPQPGAALGKPAARQVVFVLIDALRVDTAANADWMPTLNKLKVQGASATIHSKFPSYSEPGYSVLQTGAWPELSDGPAFNMDYATIPTWTQDNVFSAAHRAGLKTAVSGYYWFEKLIPQTDVDASFYTPGEDNMADRQVINAALPWVKSGTYNYILIHIDQVDYAGHHEGGPQSPNWAAAASRSDAMLAEIVGAMDLSQDTIVIASDHGQINPGGHGGQDAIVLVEPFVMAGAAVKPGAIGDVQQTDIAPTFAALLGANLPASAQGRVLTEALNLPTKTLAALPAATAAQQTGLLKAYATAIGVAIPVDKMPTGSDIAPYQQELLTLRAAKLNPERLPRALLALMLAAIPLYFIIRGFNRKRMWWLVSAGVYVLLFNLKYALVDGKTYTFSSVGGSMDLIVRVGLATAIALGLAWLLSAWRTGLFRLKPLAAVEESFAQCLIVLYVLALPVLVGFTLNTLSMTTWHLAEPVSNFLTLLAFGQGIFVGVVALLLAGLAALIAALKPQKT